MLEHAVATQVGSLLQGVVRYGTGTRAQVAGIVVAGKTGTTEGYGDAWFVGWTPKYTVAVWVGYPNEFKSMETEYEGQPVAGGTYPAAIFQTFIERRPAQQPAEGRRGRRTGDADRAGAGRDRARPRRRAPTATARARHRAATGGAAASARSTRAEPQATPAPHRRAAGGGDAAARRRRGAGRPSA